MDAMIRFATSDDKARSPKSNYKGCLESIYQSHPIVSGILTVCSAKNPVIAAKKNKITSLDDNEVILSISKVKNPKIAYIAVKKIKKRLTFDYRCVRNSLLLK